MQLKKNALRVGTGLAMAGMLALQIMFAPGASSATGKVTVWLEEGDTAACFTDVLTSANKNSGLSFDMTVKPLLTEAMRTALAAGGAPDVIFTPGPAFTSEFAKAGLLEPLDSYAKKFGWNESISPWNLALGKVKGKLYSLGSEQETMLLWYNKTVLEQLGVKVPKTTKQFSSALRKVAASGGVTPFAGGNTEWKPVNEWFLSAMWNAVAGPENVYKALTGKMKWNSKPFVQATNTLNGWMKQGYMSGGLDRYYTKTFEEFQSDHANGKAAFSMEGSWRFGNIASQFEESGQEWGWAPFPTKDGKELYSIGVGSSWGINKSSKNQAGAAEFLKTLFSPTTQANLVIKCGMSPAPVQIAKKMLAGQEKRHADSIVRLGQAAAKGNFGYLTWAFWPPKTQNFLIEEIEKVWAGSVTTKQYLQGIDKVFAEELASKSVPPIPARG